MTAVSHCKRTVTEKYIVIEFMRALVLTLMLNSN